MNLKQPVDLKRSRGRVLQVTGLAIAYFIISLFYNLKGKPTTKYWVQITLYLSDTGCSWLLLAPHHPHGDANFYWRISVRIGNRTYKSVKFYVLKRYLTCVMGYKFNNMIHNSFMYFEHLYLLTREGIFMCRGYGSRA